MYLRKKLFRNNHRLPCKDIIDGHLLQRYILEHIIRSALYSISLWYLVAMGHFGPWTFRTMDISGQTLLKSIGFFCYLVINYVINHVFLLQVLSISTHLIKHPSRRSPTVMTDSVAAVCTLWPSQFGWRTL
jgi:hypothetical protein